MYQNTKEDSCMCLYICKPIVNGRSLSILGAQTVKYLSMQTVGRGEKNALSFWEAKIINTLCIRRKRKALLMDFW